MMHIQSAPLIPLTQKNETNNLYPFMEAATVGETRLGTIYDIAMLDPKLVFYY